MEILDVVNEKDEIIGQASMKEAFEKKLMRRIIHVLIFNDKGEMALQLRSKHKSFCPGYWSTTVGGHVQSGESYEQGALREFQEELGTTTDIQKIQKDLYDDSAGLKMWLTTFKAVYNGKFEVNPEEVDKVEYFSLEQIQTMKDSGEKFHPELLFLLQTHYGIK